MEKISFSTNISAPREKVWKILWDDATYRQWTSVFSESSYAESDWQEGSKILFLDGKGNGMVSQIETNRPYEFMSFKHLGEVKNGIEDTESEAVKVWSGSHENYRLDEVDGTTTLVVEMDITEDFKNYFVDTMPKALDIIKELAEKQ